MSTQQARVSHKGPPIDIQRWRRARELQQQGLSQVQIGLELDPPCAASVVWKGLRRLRAWEALEAQNVRAKPPSAAQRTDDA